MKAVGSFSRCMSVAVILLSALFTPQFAVPAATVDSSFNASPDDSVMTIALQPDGKILVGGRFTEINGTPRSHLARLETNGALDPSFHPENAPGQIVYRVLVSDGKIYAGAADGLRRYSLDGTLDWHSSLYPLTFAVDGNGRVLVGGAFTRLEGQYHRGLARLTADGLLDESFHPEVGCCAGDAVHEIYVTENAFFVGGRFGSVNGVVRDNFAKLHLDGSLDTSFVATADALVLSVAPLSDGRVWRASEQTLQRHLPNGDVDEAFASVSAGFDVSDRFVVVAAQPDGKAIVGGAFTLDNGATQTYVARFNPDGSRDATFDAAPNGFVQAIAVQPGGGVLLGGSFTSVNGVERRHIVRLPGDSPTLSAFQTAAGDLVLCWPANYTNHVLESSNLGMHAWGRVTNPPAIIAGMRIVTNSTAGAGRVFRLALP